MVSRSLVTFLDYLCRTVRADGRVEASDGELLRCFVEHQDESAFEALLLRHGPLVWGVCRRILTDANDADDAFQATFLVLVRRAGSIRKHDSVASWLHGVARRLALRARAQAQRRRHEERKGSPMPSCDENSAIGPAGDLRVVVDEELGRLPEKYRAPLVLCYLEGKSVDETAQALGLARGTVASRMSRGRDLLRGRMSRRGLTLLAGTFDAALTEQMAPTAVSPPLVRTTLESALAYAVGTTPATAATAVSLAEGVLYTMHMTKVKLTVSLVLVLSLVGAGTGALLLPSSAETAKPQAAAAEPPPAVGQDAEEQEPLPAQALRRLGSLRLRNGGTISKSAVALSRDGKTLAIGGKGPFVTLWDRASGKEIGRFPASGAVALTDDGTVLASYREKDLTFWNTQTGKKLRDLQPQVIFGRMVFSPDGKSLAGEGGILDVESGTLRQGFLWGEKRLNNYAGELAFSPDGKTFTNAGNEVELWDALTGKKTVGWKGEFFSVPQCVVFSSDSKLLATGGICADHGKKALQVHEARTGKEVFSFSEENLSIVSVAFSADGKRLLAVGNRGKLLAWEVETWKALPRVDLAVPAAVNQRNSQIFALSPDGAVVAGCTESVQLFDTATGKPLHKPRGSLAPINALVFSRDGKSLTAGSNEDTRIWDVTSGQETKCIDIPCTQFSPDGKQSACIYRDPQRELWNFAPPQRVAVHDLFTGRVNQLKGFDSLGITQIAFSPDGRRLAWSSPSECVDPQGRPRGGVDSLQIRNVVRVWDVGTAEELPQSRPGEGPKRGDLGHPLVPGAKSLAFAPDGETLVVVLDTGDIVLHDVATLKTRRRFAPEKEFQDWVRGHHDRYRISTPFCPLLRFSPDGKLLAVGAGETVFLWETASGTLYRRLKQSAVTALAFSADGKRLAVGEEDGAVRLWDPFSGQLLQTLSGHRGQVGALAFALDGKTLASGSADTTVLLWDLRAVSGAKPRLVERSEEERERLWESLKTATAGEAMRELAESGTALVPFLQARLERLPAVKQLTGAEIEQHIKDLDQDSFQVRDLATKELEASGKEALAAVRKALANKPALEIRRRLERIEQNLSEKLAAATIPPEQLRAMRAVQILEQIGTPEAAKALEQLARRGEGDPLGSDARGTLERLRLARPQP